MKSLSCLKGKQFGAIKNLFFFCLVLVILALLYFIPYLWHVRMGSIWSLSSHILYGYHGGVWGNHGFFSLPRRVKRTIPWPAAINLCCSARCRYLAIWFDSYVHPTNYVLFFSLKLFIYIYIFFLNLVGRMSSKSIIAYATETSWTQNRLWKRQRKVSCSTYILYYIGDAPHIW